jgi:hypothetical protein
MVRHLVLALFVLLSGGCATWHPGGGKAEPLPYGVDLSFIHPIEDPGPQPKQACAGLPLEARDHVYVYFINGLDPLCVGNFKGLCHYVKTLGFSHCYYGEMWHMRLFREMIGKVRTRDPAARIVLVGYSAGANCVRDLSHDLKQDGLRVDLLVYIGADTIRNVAHSRPDNAGRLLNVTGHGLAFLGYDLIFNGADIDGAVNHRLKSRHMLLPSRKQTAELLVSNLIDVCQAQRER